MLVINQNFSYSACQNMALDAWLLQEMQDEVILRVFEFSKPSITLGFSMKPHEWLEQIPKNIDMSKRVTGGKALVHSNGLTYAIHIPKKMMPENLYESYKSLSQPIFDSLKAFDSNLEFSEDDLFIDKKNPICFMEHKTETICVGGAKIVGSAQKRTKNGILQHGEINLFPNDIDMCSIFKIDKSQIISQQDYQKRCSSLLTKELMTNSIEIKSDIKQNIIKNFEKNYGKSTPYPIKSIDQNAIDILAKKLEIKL
ncbi:MAG: hypothetical protein COB02_15780 [Candidatus Cloacimonadota bacterium]|nr:MAG: hypothetical protein COB02_15780 [Candidatus Cloacimonadota bacterium]